MSVHYFQAADFKSDIGFRKFLAQIPKFGHFGLKSINFLILMKFCMYTISNVLIANLTLAFEKFEPKSLNLGIMGKKYQFSNLNEILPLYYFEGADFKSDIGF